MRDKSCFFLRVYIPTSLGTEKWHTAQIPVPLCKGPQAGEEEK